MLPLTLGLSDGIFNALILASAAVIDDARGVTVELAMKVGCVAFVTAFFTMFVADYAELRSRLSRATRQLNLSANGHLATTQLGRRAVFQAVQAAAIASVSSFVGSATPLIIAGSFRSASWIGLVVAVAFLGGLGAALAASFGGRRWRWVIGLIVAGVAVAAIGSRLNVA
jgi:VIT1/CCC1 family predicted Fe2+/Mn2+ transporter